MSLEKKRETKETKKEKKLEDSSFRQMDFTPLEEKLEKTHDKVSITDELTEIENDVLEIAKDVLKLKRYDAEFAVESESEIQRYPIIEKLYAKCIAKLSYKKGYSKNDIFLAIRNLEE
ncbi:MAG: hypothetical protein ACFFAO_11800, partial [Candidatus Hermodarchaeota archaeon]